LISEPDFPVPDIVKPGGPARARAQRHALGQRAGTVLLDAIRRKFHRLNECGREEVMAGSGAKQVMLVRSP
jgi:hypothetical protein